MMCSLSLNLWYYTIKQAKIQAFCIKSDFSTTFGKEKRKKRTLFLQKRIFG